MDFEAIVKGMEVAYKVGAPIREELPVPVELSEICNIVTVPATERVWVPTNTDNSDGIIYDVDVTNAIITTQKVDPINETQLTFKQLNSPLFRVNLPAVLNSPNGDAILARKKDSIRDAMDKTEVRKLLSALFSGADRADGGAPENSAVATVTPETGADLFDVIASMLEEVEDYCDGEKVLYAGSTAYNKINRYDKDHVTTNNFKMSIHEFLRQNNVTLRKISGLVQNTGDSSAQRLMDANKMALFGIKSSLHEGKPITFVRKNIAAGNYPGFKVEQALQRAYLYTQIPMVDTVSTDVENLLSYGLLGYEVVIFTIDNPKAIAITTDLEAAGVYDN